MKRRALSVTALRTLALASAGLVAASGCLNPRPEELPSNTIAIDPDDGQQPGAGAGTPTAPAPEGPNFSPSDPDSSPEEGDGAAPDGGLPDAEAADAGAPLGEGE